jgi:saposin
MDVRVGLLVLFVLGANWACGARQLENPFISDIEINYNALDGKIQASKEVTGNQNVCTLCEEFAAEALDYLGENKTQKEIIEVLHLACHRTHSLKHQCITLVDYYAPLFFLEISSIQPGLFCQKVDLCQKIAMFSAQIQEDSCELCHHAVSEVLDKLKDPDTQMEIIEILLKACNSVETYMKKCKRIVFEYGPLVLANAEKFLETTDICTTLHACKSKTSVSQDVPLMTVPELSES